MAATNFVDYVKVFCRSGNGGGGIVHFRHEKFIEFGGPDGGNGGRGGHIILRGSSQHWTLVHLKHRKHIYAEDGIYGGPSRMTGANGNDMILDVPLGTIARDSETGEKMCEVTEDGQEVILLRGGRGGMGNTHFKSATNQAPRFAQPGGECIEGWFILELKVLADVGLVGFPNAGKSTLLSVVSAAKPKIANYPFTTLEPNLGIVAYRDHLSFVMADIPGIIEGAHTGRGIGTRFLRHIERNSALLFMVSAESDSISEEYKILLNELKQFNPELLDKERILAITKSDMLDEELIEDITQEIEKEGVVNIPFIFISSVVGKNIVELKDMIWESLHK